MPSFSTAGCNSSQLCTTQLCLLVAEAALSQTRHEVKAELARNRAYCYGNSCLFGDVV